MNNIDSFIEYLKTVCKYPEEAIRSNTYRYDGKDYGRVEVMSSGYVIQAFVLMSQDHCEALEKFPFYRVYSQWSENGYSVPPACNVVVYEKDEKWHIHNSSDLRAERTDPNFLNYEKAVERFEKRLNYIGNQKLAEIVKRFSIALLVFVVLYLCAHILSVNGLLGDICIPLNAYIISILVTAMCLLLVPPMLPYVRSLKVGDIGLDLIERRGKR